MLAKVTPLLLGLLTASCAGDGILQSSAPPPRDEGPAVSFATDVQPIFNQYCAFPGCHAPPGEQQGLVLEEGSSYASLVGVRSAEVPGLFRVDPGNPADSYLMIKLVGTDPRLVQDRMPLGGPFLDEAERAPILRWIETGAQDN